MTSTRRARVRAATIEEIKEAALAQIASEGAAALSIRGVAREIGMSPAGLYRYYEGLDGLLTELITDAYNDLADEVEAEMGRAGDVRARLRAGMIAYRRWCVDHPNRFLLLYGTPIPGYTAPEDGPTARASRRIGTAFLSLVIEGWSKGELHLPDVDRPAEPGEVAFVSEHAPGFPPQWMSPFLSTWAHFHGMVTLEILNHLDWVYPDAAVFYEAEIDRIVEGWRT